MKEATRRTLERVTSLLAGLLGVLVLIIVLTGGFEFEYGWIGYACAVLLIGWGIREIIIIIKERRRKYVRS